MTNVSVWDTRTEAEHMATLQPMETHHDINENFV
jgi:hypothetical protein